MAGEGVEVAADGLHIYLLASHCLGTVDEGQAPTALPAATIFDSDFDGARGIGDGFHAATSRVRIQQGQG